MPTDRCPKCGKDVPADAKTAPFCSDRCRLIDLGGWLEGRYRIPGPPVEVEQPQQGEDDDPKVKH